MNATDNLTQDCNPLHLYAAGEPRVSQALLWGSLVHCYCVMVLGTLGNALALWCVGTCAKTRGTVKALLVSVFLPALLVCLATRPIIVETRYALLTCDSHRVSVMALRINMTLYNILAQTELASIAVVAVIRVVSVWAPQTQTLGLRWTVGLVTAIWMYSILTGLGMMGLVMTGEVDRSWSIITALYFLNTTLPALITAAAYIVIIVIMRRNKRRLADSQQQRRPRGTTMDQQVTLAMQAVFLSNMVFGLPHSVYHLMGKQPYYLYIIFHILFSTHFVMDPLAFVWFNRCYRRRVLSRMKNMNRSMTSRTASSVPLGSSASQSVIHHHHPELSKETL
ncbi:hypothetical protein GWK47_035042 [Chionoecetes opilio]|uniref:G-protein coupled receptors family 1 profile domain-containing protein n=1 Tax=Chionoecetes opilio TaxID=41210 RepID=A0A8J5D0G4_CHIOP|nr:hypothetical protein GWK47_035042 [Chionoecetes opilio]